MLPVSFPALIPRVRSGSGNETDQYPHGLQTAAFAESGLSVQEEGVLLPGSAIKR